MPKFGSIRSAASPGTHTGKTFTGSGVLGGRSNAGSAKSFSGKGTKPISSKRNNGKTPKVASSKSFKKPSGKMPTNASVK